MKQVFGTRYPGVWVVVLGLVWGCTRAGGNDSAERRDPPPAQQAAPPAAESPQVTPAPASDFDKEAAMAEARRRAQETPPPAVGTAPAQGSAPAVDTSSLTPAPVWEAQNLGGARVTNADFAGKVIILDFWATWCGPCKREIPHFIELYTEYQGLGLEVVGVDVGEPSSRVGPFVQQAGINYNMVLGTQKMVNDYGPINGIPTTYVISQDGKIFRRYVGYRPKETFEQDVRTLLGMTS